MQWTEEFRPSNLSEVIGQERTVTFFKNQALAKPVTAWSHVIFFGSPGTGKTTMAEAIANEYDLQIVEINASHYRKIDDMEEVVMNVVKQMPEKGERKILFLDEADGLTPNSQWMLRRLMEEYSNVTMFILACNNDAKIIDAIYDRCLEFYFAPLKAEELKTVAANICNAEQRDVPNDVKLEELINASDGSARSFTNLLYQLLVGGVMPELSFNVAEYIKAVKNNDLETAKKLTVKTTFKELLREVLKVLLRYGEKYEDAFRKLGDYFLLSPNPDDNLGKILVTLQLKKLLNSEKQSEK